MANEPEGKPPVPPPADQPAKPAAAPPAAAPPAAAPAKPAAPPAPKAPAIAPAPLDNEMVQRYKARFGEELRAAWVDRKQAILVVGREHLLEIAQYTRDEEQFDYLVDLTAVDWPKRERRFDLVLILYSFAKNERVRLRVEIGEHEPVTTVEGIWPTANWLEREVYDMFGIVFAGHSYLKRLLLPEEWQGFPLRKDYDILKQDEAWVRENLGIESGQ